MLAAAQNEALAILDHVGALQRLTFMIWGLVSGTTHSPGLAVLARDLIDDRPAAWSRYTAAQRGRLAASRPCRAERKVPAALREAAAMTTIAGAGSSRRDPPNPTVSVVVATYKRMDHLIECLAGLRKQTRPADEVIVVVHDSDEETGRLVEQTAAQWSALRCVRVDRDGLVAACNQGLAASRAAIVAFVDDDAVPSANWLDGIVRTFEGDERIVGVGGRDMVVADGRVVEATRRSSLGRSSDALEVGRIQWFGRMIANHHVGTGQARDVDVLKGVNMSFRRAAVAAHGFDERLRGRGSQVHSELSICLPLRRQGLRLVYDPGIVVYHYPAPRPHGDRRDDLGGEAMFAAAHNEALAILEHFGPLQRLLFMAWGFAVGVTHSPGLAVLARDLIDGRPASWARFAAAQRGRLAAWRTLRTARLVPAASPDGPEDANGSRRQ
jgi:GT2 family glycosyltransferase